MTGISGMQQGRVVTLTQPAVAIAAASVQPEIVASWRGTRRNIELSLAAQSISAYSSSGNFFPPYTGPALVGGASSSGEQDPPRSGFFKLEYGYGGLINTRYVDLRAARLYLGVCEQVTVSAALWRGSSAWVSSSYSMQAAASIGEATGGAYDEMIATTMAYTAAGARISEILTAPVGATAFEAAVYLLSGITSWFGSTEPSVSFRTYGAAIAFDAVNAKVTPSNRRFPVDAASISVEGAAVTTLATGLTVRFILNS